MKQQNEVICLYIYMEKINYEIIVGSEINKKNINIKIIITVANLRL